MIRTSAPGRVGIIGGYSILEKGNTSYSFCVDARVHAEITPASTIQIKTDQFSIDTQAKWHNGQLVLENDVLAAAFAKAAVQTVFEYIEFKKAKIKPFSLTTQSDNAFNQGGGKTGLGSSAAATAAMVHAVLLHHGISDLTNTHHCAQVAHSKAQGKVGSGYDIAAAVFGSQEYQRYSPALIDGFPKNSEKQWDYFLRPVQVPPFFQLALATFPKEGTSTVSMTKLTGAWKKAYPDEYAELMRELNDANVDAIAYLEQLQTEKTDENLSLFKQFFETGRALTRKLGEKSGAPIETAEIKALIDDSLKNGAFVCKTPGAGGKDNLAALCLSQSDAEQLKTFWKSKGLEPLDVKIQNEGVQVEKK